MKSQKKSPASAKTGLKKEGDVLLDSARIIAKTSDPVKLVAPLIEYHRLSIKLYKKNLRVK